METPGKTSIQPSLDPSTDDPLNADHQFPVLVRVQYRLEEQWFDFVVGYLQVSGDTSEHAQSLAFDVRICSVAAFPTGVTGPVSTDPGTPVRRIPGAWTFSVDGTIEECLELWLRRIGWFGCGF